MSIDCPSDHPSSLTLTDEELFCLEGCRSYKQYYGMRKGFEDGVCAFCNPDPELNQIVWKDNFMMVWHIHEKFMRKDKLNLHLLIVPKRHIRFVADLPDKAGVSLIQANRFVKQYFGYTGGLNHAREGDMRLNAGTVPHLHWNLFEPNGTTEVEVPVFKNTADRAKNQDRARQFSSQYGQRVTPAQFEQMVEAGLMNENGYPI